ncbi:MAG: DUF4178 domain-containing protein [Deltaproteobacteria bacterium]|nr:DUF4178 domain-containing protein [Deltaproteobacteria bacterium]
MEKERFDLNKRRERPPYKPKDIHCPNCGAALTIKDERSELLVCDYCESHLDVSEAEKKVLGKGPEHKQEFPLQLGDSFQYKGARYEIISRMAFVEDFDYTEMTRQYLLYNPRRGTMWLDEYMGRYSISSDTHVMPTSNPFTKQRGDILDTYDERKWVTEGTGTYELVHVDGSLPWIAKVGDKIQYAEFSEKSGSGLQYEVQSIGREIEYGTGKALPIELVRRATKKPDLGTDIPRKDPLDAAKTMAFYKSLMLVSFLSLVVNGILALYCISCGEVVLYQKFTASELNGEVFSYPFDVAKQNNVIKIETSAEPRLNNEWMAMDIAVVESEDIAIHVFDSNIQYYQGVEGDERWSEGSQHETAYVKIPRAGTYSLLLHAVSARGNTSSASKSTHGAAISVTDGALLPHFFIGAGILSVIILVLTVVSYSKWKQEDEE